MIRIVLTASQTPFGAAIRWITKGQVSHAMIQSPDPQWGGEWIAQATLPQVVRVPAEHARHNVYVEYRCKFDAEAALPKLRDFMGEWYGFGGIVILGWIKLWWRVFKRKLKVPHYTVKGQFCSELVARFFQAADLPEVAAWDVERITPEDIRRYCERHPDLFEKIEASALF